MSGGAQQVKRAFNVERVEQHVAALGVFCYATAWSESTPRIGLSAGEVMSAPVFGNAPCGAFPSTPRSGSTTEWSRRR
jgi:hypothetical protein